MYALYTIICILFVKISQSDISPPGNTNPGCNERKCEFIARHGMTFDETTSELLLRRSQKYTLRVLDGYNNGNNALFVGLWERNCPNQIFRNYAVLSMDLSSFESQLIQQKINGFCLVFVNAYNISPNQPRFIAMWEDKNGQCGDDIIEAHSLSSNDYQNLFNTLTQAGYRLHWTSAHDVNGVARFATIFKKGISNNFVSFHGLTSQEYQDKFDYAVNELNMRLIWVNGYMVSGAIRFIALFDDSSGPVFEARHGMTSSRYQCIFDNFVFSGYGLKHVTGYGDVSISSRFAAVWELDTMNIDDLQFIDDTVNALRDAYSIDGTNKKMSVSIAISHFGRIVFAKGYGLSSIDDNEPACPTTMYRIGSISKTITSAGILLLIQNNVNGITLESKVFGAGGLLHTRYDISSTHSAIEDIKVWHLLSHTSRIRRDAGLDDLFEVNVSADEMIQLFLTDDEIFRTDFVSSNEIGVIYKYSNIGYAILGQIIVQITNQGYESWIKNNLLFPSGTNNDPRLGGTFLFERYIREAVYQPMETAYNLPDILNYPKNLFKETAAAAGGWTISPIHLLNFIARIDGFDEIPDILDDERITNIETSVPNSPYSKGGGWFLETNGRQHGGSTVYGSASYMHRLNNGISGAIFVNYNNDNDVFSGDNSHPNTLKNIITNVDITYPCYNVDKTSNTNITTFTLSDIDVTRRGLEKLSAVPPFVVLTESTLDVNVIPSIGTVPVYILSYPISKRFPCTVDGKVCEDGQIVGRNPNNNCEFFPCDCDNDKKDDKDVSKTYESRLLYQ